jgi:hypothetical protein
MYIHHHGRSLAWEIEAAKIKVVDIGVLAGAEINAQAYRIVDKAPNGVVPSKPKGIHYGGR